MAALGKDRARATRIRAKGGRASATDREWLRAYIDRRKSRVTATRPPDKDPEPAKDAAVSAPIEPATPPDPAPAAVPTGHVEIAFPSEPEEKEDVPEDPVPDRKEEPDATAGESPASGDAVGGHDRSGPPPATCGDPTCPRCAKNVGGHQCRATGLTVWNPIDEDAARGMAKLLFGGITIIVRMFRKDKAWIPPTDAEVNQLGRALQKVTYRRINAIGAIDDLLMLGAALGMYVTRATTAPAITSPT